MGVLDLVKLPPLMERTQGRADFAIGLIDGPVLRNHPDLAGESIREMPGRLNSTCTQATTIACRHGTFVAGILSAKRNAGVPAICPGCSLLVRPIFGEAFQSNSGLPSAEPEELAEAILDCIRSGARLLNLSVAIAQPSTRNEHALKQALDEAVQRGVLVVAAAGNQGMLGGTAIIGHPWVIPVAACDGQGSPLGKSNFGGSIGRHGLLAPGDRVTSLGFDGNPFTGGGTSAATPFVTGALALLGSEFPKASAAELKLAILQSASGRRVSVIPPVLDAWRAYQSLSSTRRH